MVRLAPFCLFKGHRIRALTLCDNEPGRYSAKRYHSKQEGTRRLRVYADISLGAVVLIRKGSG
jgi:hypothetical protein